MQGFPCFQSSRRHSSSRRGSSSYPINDCLSCALYGSADDAQRFDSNFTVGLGEQVKPRFRSPSSSVRRNIYDRKFGREKEANRKSLRYSRRSYIYKQRLIVLPRCQKNDTRPRHRRHPKFLGRGRIGSFDMGMHCPLWSIDRDRKEGPFCSRVFVNVPILRETSLFPSSILLACPQERPEMLHGLVAEGNHGF